MKEINEYRKSATIYFVPNLRNGNSLKIEFTLPFANAVFSDILQELRKKFGFSCSEANSHFNTTTKPNIIDISLDLCIDEREVAQDLFNYLETILGKDQVIDRIRTTIKKENKKMQT